jgi:hypothetical protein
VCLLTQDLSDQKIWKVQTISNGNSVRAISATFKTQNVVEKIWVENRVPMGWHILPNKIRWYQHIQYVSTSKVIHTPGVQPNEWQKKL